MVGTWIDRTGYVFSQDHIQDLTKKATTSLSQSCGFGYDEKTSSLIGAYITELCEKTLLRPSYEIAVVLLEESEISSEDNLETRNQKIIAAAKRLRKVTQSDFEEMFTLEEFRNKDLTLPVFQDVCDALLSLLEEMKANKIPGSFDRVFTGLSFAIIEAFGESAAALRLHKREIGLPVTSFKSKVTYALSYLRRFKFVIALFLAIVFIAKVYLY